MARINRAELTRQEIIRHAANRFLEIGYSKTSIHAMSKALDMSTGNMTFYFPTKEHILAELVDMLCQFQWSLMEYEAKEGVSSVMAVCLELLTMAAACEQDAVNRPCRLHNRMPRPFRSLYPNLGYNPGKCPALPLSAGKHCCISCISR